MVENPYESSYASENEDAPTSRPVSVTVFGILNLVFAMMSFCGIGFSLLAFAIPQNANFPNPAMDIMRENQFYMVYSYAALMLGFVFTFVLVIAGVGLLQFKPYGRRWSIVYAVYAIVSCILGTAVMAVCLVAPLMEKLQNMPNDPAKVGAVGGAIGGLVGGLLGLVYPILLLVFMYRRNVVLALRPEREFG